MSLWLIGWLVHIWTTGAIPTGNRNDPGQALRAVAGQVRIDAVVTDRHGQPIQGLGLADFELRDGGTRRALTAVDFRVSPRHRPAVPGSIATPQDEARAARETGTRVFAFFFDEFHISPGMSAARAADTIGGFIEEKLHPHDLAAVIRPEDDVSAVRFTRDRAASRGVLASISGRKGDFTPHTLWEAREVGVDAAAAPAARRTIVMDKLNALALRLGEMQADRAILVFVSEGFPDAPGHAASGTSAAQQVIRASSQFHFPIYSFHPAAPDEDEASPTERERDTPVLRVLAEQTGGLFITPDNSIAGFARIAHDTEAYYSLAYAPSSLDGGPHPIVVHVNRPGATVRTRTHYWAVPAGAAPSVDSLPAVSVSTRSRPLRRSELVDIWVGARREPDGTNGMTVTWEPRMGGLRTPRTVRVKARDMDGRPLCDCQIAAVGQANDHARFTVRAGRVELDFEILDAAGAAIGTDARDVGVPDMKATEAGRPWLLSPEVVRTRTPGALKHVTTETAPTPARTFARAEGVLVRAPAYDPTGTSVRVSARLLNRVGQSIRDIPTVGAATAELPSQFVLPLAGMAPALYHVELVATNRNGTVKNRLAFRVVN